MARLACITLGIALTGAAASAEPTKAAGAWRIEGNTVPKVERLLPGVELGSTGRVGLGMFGLKANAANSPAVTVRDVNAPRQRRAGIGLSLKF